MLRKKPTIKGSNCLVTGGARGMGKLWAERFAGDGARVVLWDLDEAELERTATGLRNKGVSVFTQVVDVTDRERVYAAAKEVATSFGPIDILVNNAGVVSAGPFLDMPDEKLALTIDVDLKALMWTMKAFLPAMLAKGRGWILNVSSASGFIGVPYMPAYAASKWGVLGLTDSLRLEMGLSGHKEIGFSVFCPSYVDTGMFDGVKAPRLVPILSPEEAVRRGYKAFCRGEYVIVEPLVAKITPALKTLLPRPIFDAVTGILGVTTSMKQWTGRQ